MPEPRCKGLLDMSQEIMRGEVWVERVSDRGSTCSKPHQRGTQRTGNKQKKAVQLASRQQEEGQ